MGDRFEKKKMKTWQIELKAVTPIGIGGIFYVQAENPCEADMIFYKEQGPSYGSDTVIVTDWQEKMEEKE